MGSYDDAELATLRARAVPEGPEGWEVTATAGLDVAHAALQRRLAGGDE